MRTTGITRLHDRALEPVARCLIRHLMVPDVYFEATFPGRRANTDIVLIDRAGAGDVHLVEVKVAIDKALAAIPVLLRVPAHYRWVACFGHTISDRTRAHLRRGEGLLPPTGAGRIGVIEVIRSEPDDLTAGILVNAERFLEPVDPEALRAFADRHPPSIRFD